jgi:hypothetical protein
MSELVFMSPEHVARMNQILAADAGSHAACAALGRRWDMVYELSHGAQTVWWTMRFDPVEGVSFHLEAPTRPADILLRGEYRAMMQWMRSSRAGSKEPEPVIQSGDPEGMNIIGPAYQAAAKVATLSTEIPVV